MQTINITAHTEDASQIEAIKAVIKAFKIKYSISKEEESPYNPEFVAMIKKGDKEFAEGKGIKMSVADFKELCK
jgi:dsRNA-specific ribonuclease